MSNNYNSIRKQTARAAIELVKDPEFMESWVEEFVTEDGTKFDAAEITQIDEALRLAMPKIARLLASSEVAPKVSAIISDALAATSKKQHKISTETPWQSLY